MTPQSKNIEPYLATGFESIKLGSNSKAPIQKNWTKCKSLSTNQAISWMEKGNNIGVRMRPIDLIIDVDPRNFEAGITIHLIS